jgi:hypothetical protein
MQIMGMEFLDTGDVTIEDLIEQAARQHPGINLAKTIEKGRLALERASDPAIDSAQREEAWRRGMAFVDWMTALFHAAHARKQRNARKAAKPRLPDRGGKGSEAPTRAMV